MSMHTSYSTSQSTTVPIMNQKGSNPGDHFQFFGSIRGALQFFIKGHWGHQTLPALALLTGDATDSMTAPAHIILEPQQPLWHWFWNHGFIWWIEVGQKLTLIAQTRGGVGDLIICVLQHANNPLKQEEIKSNQQITHENQLPNEYGIEMQWMQLFCISLFCSLCYFIAFSYQHHTNCSRKQGTKAENCTLDQFYCHSDRSVASSQSFP